MAAQPGLRRARAAIAATFLGTGFVVGTWLVNIPAAQARSDSSSADLGTVLLVLGGGAFLAMQVSGRLCARHGSRRVATVGAIWLAAALNLPGQARDLTALTLALLTLGVGNGLVNVAMNAQAAEFEQRYARPTMSSFHAFFSIGGAAAAGLTAAATGLGATLPTTLAAASVLALSLTALTAPQLLPAPPDRVARQPDTSAPRMPAGTTTRRSVALLAGVSFMMMLAEGAAGDWSSLHAVHVLHSTPAGAALTYGAFALTMTIGRLCSDHVVSRTSSTTLILAGTLLAGCGFLIVVLSSHLAVATAGWALAGLGLSGIVPQLVSAAGRSPGPHPERRLATVVSTGYLGLLAGPAVIGHLAQASSLPIALALVPALCFLSLLATTLPDQHRRRGHTA